MPRESQTPPRTSGAFRVGEWLVEPDLNRIFRDDETVHLEPRVMEVLVQLACHVPNVVTRQQLIDGVWDGGFITDNTLTHSIAELRRALGDDARQPAYIETIHRRGYRLLERVTDFARSSAYRFRQTFPLPGPDRQSLRAAQGGRESDRQAAGGVAVCPFTSDLSSSRAHHRCRLVAYLEDLGSKNGTMLNGRRIESREQASATAIRFSSATA